MKKLTFTRHLSTCIGLALLVLFPNDHVFAQQTYRLSKAPYYKTFDNKATLPADARLVHVPVSIDRMTREEFFYKGREEVLEPIVRVLNGYLDSLDWSSPISAASHTSDGAPGLFVGSSESVIAPPAAEMLREETDKFPPMAMQVSKPGREWKEALLESMHHAGSEYALVFWIGFNEYPKANKGLFKKKVVLGTGHEPEIRFLSAELEPVEVLQITGMLLDKNGNVARAGAEAFLYEDSPFWVQVLGASTSIDDKTLGRTISDIRREDLPGKPLAWEVAMYHLVQHLTQRPATYTSR